MYIITKDIFGDWKKGALVSRGMVSDYFDIPEMWASKIIQKLVEKGIIKPYKPKK